MIRQTGSGIDASSLATRERVATELRQLRDTWVVLRERNRKSKTIRRALILDLLAGAVEEGLPGLTLHELSSRLSGRGVELPAERRKAVGLVRKALHDLGKMVDAYYVEKGDREHKITISTDGFVSMEESCARNDFGSSNPLSTTLLDEVVTAYLSALPTGPMVASVTRRPSAPSDVPMQFRWLWKYMPSRILSNLDSSHLYAVRSNLSRLIWQYAVDRIICHRAGGASLIAVARFPPHDLDVWWGESGNSLNRAYRVFKESSKPAVIIRLIIFDEGFRPPPHFLARWIEHVRTRLQRGERVRVLTSDGALRSRGMLIEDSIILPDEMVAKFPAEDFPNEIRLLAPDDEEAIQAQRAVTMAIDDSSKCSFEVRIEDLDDESSVKRLVGVLAKSIPHLLTDFPE